MIKVTLEITDYDTKNSHKREFEVQNNTIALEMLTQIVSRELFRQRYNNMVNSNDPCDKIPVMSYEEV